MVRTEGRKQHTNSTVSPSTSVYCHHSTTPHSNAHQLCHLFTPPSSILPCITIQLYHNPAHKNVGLLDSQKGQGQGGREHYVACHSNHLCDFLSGPTYNDNTKLDLCKISAFQGALERNTNAQASLLWKAAGL